MFLLPRRQHLVEHAGVVVRHQAGHQFGQPQDLSQTPLGGSEARAILDVGTRAINHRLRHAPMGKQSCGQHRVIEAQGLAFQGRQVVAPRQDLFQKVQVGPSHLLNQQHQAESCRSAAVNDSSPNWLHAVSLISRAATALVSV